MESLTSLFDRRRTKASSILLLARYVSEGDEMSLHKKHNSTCSVSSRATLCKEVVPLILSRAANCSGRAREGCEWDTQVTKFCQNHRACCCRRYLLLPLNYQGFRRSRKMWRKQESQQRQKICWFIMDLVTENVDFSVRIFWLVAKMLQLPALPGLPGNVCFCSRQYVSISYASQVSFPERGGDPS